VIRPQFESIKHHINVHGILAKPPITPRDNYLVLGSTLYALGKYPIREPWQHILKKYIKQGFDVQFPADQPVCSINPPSVVRVGRDLYIDPDSHAGRWDLVQQWMESVSGDYRINICNTDGHSDGVFCPVAPGLIASTHYKTDYKESFPGWELFQIPWQLHNPLSHNNWWANDPAIDNNVAFSQHIVQQANDWVGNFKETVFEVNMLVIDEKNVVAMKEYPPMVKWLDQRGITVHHFDLRTRSFWDGGWHCLTLDIHRDDTKTDLFPERGPNGIYYRETQQI
jgi:hypothetical protein